jgi:hypothetical protein
VKTEVFFYNPYAIYRYVWHIYYGEGGFMKGVVFACSSELAEKRIRENYINKNIRKIRIIKKD